MIEGLKPYAEYKDVGLLWLGKIPKHWEIRRGKSVFKSIDVRSKAGEEELLTVSSKDGVVPRREKNVTMFMAESYEGYKLCWPGDLVINSLWAWAGGLGFSRHHGIISSAYGVYRPKMEFSYHWKYFDYLLRSIVYDWEFHVRSKGIWVSRLQLTDPSFLDMPIVLPPNSDAVAIAQFLTGASARINRLIRTKRRLIELLNEQKLAIIHRAVTRGLDPNTQLKPSGIDWLGDVPEHWDIKRLKAIAQIRYGLGQPPREAQTGLPLIRATNVDNGRILEKNLVRVDPADVPKTRNAFLKAGEIIVVRSGALTADSAIIPKEYEGAVAGYDMVVTVKKAYPEFIALALLSSYVQADQLIIASMRAAQPHLNAEELGTAIFLLPPYEQQKKIVEFVQRTGLPIETTIMRLEREIALLREYRTRLISDVVTGKLDVRGVELPAMDEAEVLEDIEIDEDIEAEELIESEEVADADN